MKRNMLSDVSNGDKGDMADDLRQVLCTGGGAGLGLVEAVLCQMGPVLDKHQEM